MLTWKSVTIATACLALAACGSSGAPATDGAVALQVASAGRNAVSTTDGTLNSAAGRLRLGTQRGDLNATRTAATTADGRIAFRYGSNDHVAAYGDGTVLGVFGAPTPQDQIPLDGSATYAGDSEVLLVTSAGLYELTGTAAITARFREGAVTTTLDQLDGRLFTGTAAPDAVDNVLQVAITETRIKDGRLSGGTIAVSSDRADIRASSNAQSDVAGFLYGPDADEIGGAFRLDDRDGGTFLMLGTFTGD